MWSLLVSLAVTGAVAEGVPTMPPPSSLRLLQRPNIAGAVLQPPTAAPLRVPPSVAAGLAVAASTTDDAPLTPQTMATKSRPAGLRVSVGYGVTIDSLSGNYLYVRQSPESRTTTAVPVPLDRTLLATLVHEGTVDDLVKGTVIDVKYDSRGVYQPDITIKEKVEVQVLNGAKVFDRGPTTLYVTTADGTSRGFRAPNDDWTGLVHGGTYQDLKPGTKVNIRFDPLGREDLSVTIVEKPAPVPERKSSGGCGCDVRGRALPTWGSLLFAMLALAAVVRRRA
jgi:hypothetical protein